MSKKINLLLALVLILTGLGSPLLARAEDSEDSLAKEEIIIIRTSGADRYKTSALVARNVSKEGTDTLVIASGADYPDALLGGNLAAYLKCPVLLNPVDDLSDTVIKEIEHLEAKNIYIVGGESSISEKVEEELKNYVEEENIHRFSGKNRYDTSVKVANFMIERGQTDGLAFASGLNFADALAGSAYISQKGYPLVLTNGKTIPKGIEVHENSIILGGIKSINIAELENARRFSGENRYATALDLAKKGFGDEIEEVILVDGENYPDALSAVPYASLVKGPILLTKTQGLDKDTLDFIKENVSVVRIVGGINSVSLKVEEQIKSQIKEDLVNDDENNGGNDPVLENSQVEISDVDIIINDEDILAISLSLSEKSRGEIVSEYIGLDSKLITRHSYKIDGEYNNYETYVRSNLDLSKVKEIRVYFQDLEGRKSNTLSLDLKDYEDLISKLDES